jgi:hypothetical protein
LKTSKILVFITRYFANAKPAQRNPKEQRHIPTGSTLNYLYSKRRNKYRLSLAGFVGKRAVEKAPNSVLADAFFEKAQYTRIRPVDPGDILQWLP